MLEKLKGLGWSVIGLAALFGLLALGLALLRGTAQVGAWALPFLSSVAGYTTVLGLPILFLLAAQRTTRPLGASGLFLASIVYGVTLWIWSLLFTLSIWGWFAVLIGLIFLGVGIVPIAALAALFNAEWGSLWQIILGAVLTFGCRGAGLKLAESCDRYKTDTGLVR